MDHYLDLTLCRDPEFPPSQLMDALYAKLHRALAQTKSSAIAVSFPGMRGKGLGQTLRLLGPAEALAALLATNWLHGMRDHVAVSALQSVPTAAAHRRLQRVQVKSSPERLRRRHMKRHGVTAEQARERIPSSAARKVNAPFLQLHSASTGQRFRLFLQLGPPMTLPETGAFNAYGLSQTASVPWF
jgi:CRISPR-associated endonuclease Csy4